jgi:mono/diheme cytochrome c family protein
MPPELGDGMEIFVDTCGGCHQLDAANTAGGVGPDLDEVLPGQSAAMIANSIRAPQDEISPGFGDPSIMPVYDANTIPDQNLDELVQYLLDSVGGNSSSASGGDGGDGGSGKGKRARGNR